jgi:ankyrin repeat protein
MRTIRELIESNDIENLEISLSSGTDVNAVYENGLTALMIACKKQSVEAVRVLLSFGADTLKKDDLGYTAKKIAYWVGEYRYGSYTKECEEIVNLIFNVQMKNRLVED